MPDGARRRGGPRPREVGSGQRQLPAMPGREPVGDGVEGNDAVPRPLDAQPARAHERRLPVWRHVGELCDQVGGARRVQRHLQRHLRAAREDGALTRGFADPALRARVIRRLVEREAEARAERVVQASGRSDGRKEIDRRSTGRARVRQRPARAEVEAGGRAAVQEGTPAPPSIRHPPPRRRPARDATARGRAIAQVAVEEAGQLRDPVDGLGAEVGRHVHPRPHQQIRRRRDAAERLDRRRGKEVAPAADQERRDLDPLELDRARPPVRIVAARVCEPMRPGRPVRAEAREPPFPDRAPASLRILEGGGRELLREHHRLAVEQARARSARPPARRSCRPRPAIRRSRRWRAARAGARPPRPALQAHRRRRPRRRPRRRTRPGARPTRRPRPRPAPPRAGPATRPSEPSEPPKPRTSTSRCA